MSRDWRLVRPPAVALFAFALPGLQNQAPLLQQLADFISAPAPFGTELPLG